MYRGETMSSHVWRIVEQCFNVCTKYAYDLYDASTIPTIAPVTESYKISYQMPYLHIMWLRFTLAQSSSASETS